MSRGGNITTCEIITVCSCVVPVKFVFLDAVAGLFRCTMVEKLLSKFIQTILGNYALPQHSKSLPQV